jgi:mono/diheme cytochrome c family protein
MCEFFLRSSGTIIAPEGIGLRSSEASDLSDKSKRRKRNMKLNQRKKLAIATFAAAALVCVSLLPARARSASQDDAAATYKTKCVACHGAKAEKKFDATRPEDEMVKAVLTGKKMEKPPNMPAYGEKGVSEDQAKALIAYMKALK